MKFWEKSIVLPHSTIIEAINVIDQSGLRIALILDESQVLKGIVTDVEVRRAILEGREMSEPVTQIMNETPYTVSESYSASLVINKMQSHHFSHIPVVDENGKLINLLLKDKLLEPTPLSNEVVLMAGGLGSRLRPLTNECPKPLLKVGGKPILENIVKNFTDSGFHNFFISLNYKGEMIKTHFGDGEQFNANIRYLEEHERLGTAGALSLIDENVDQPIFVMNGDLLTSVDFHHVLSYHQHHGADATMCVREYDITVPYGVVDAENEFITSIQEKPVQRFFVNAGIYILEPKVLKMIPKGEYFDMTTLFQNMLNANHKIASFPLREYWMDIGKIDDYLAADQHYSQVIR